MSERVRAYVTGEPPDRLTDAARRRVRWPEGMRARLVLMEEDGAVLWASEAVVAAGGDSVTVVIPESPVSL